ncbi:MAG TPA: acyl-CoA synthetase [Acidimicrobiales bacterium]|nr:acyl-CoA synthetase [Acidimicrobiales bacterium]
MDVKAALDAVRQQLQVGKVLVGAGVLRPERPDRLLAMGSALRRWGPTVAGGYVAGAARQPDATALIDEAGTLTFADVHRRTNAIAAGLQARGIGAGDGVAVLCRNHRGFVEASVAVSKLGANVLYLNTGFAGPQLAEVLEREGAKAVVFDAEFTELVEPCAGDRVLAVAWHEGLTPHSTLDELAEKEDPADLSPPARPGRIVILTSGTTGAPKGAARGAPKGLGTAAALLSRIPLHARETTVIAAPLFHSWGLAHMTLGMALGSTLAMRRRFEPESTLRLVAETGATALVVVPVMLQRILALPEATTSRYDTSSLRVVAASGSALTGELALRWMDRFGDNLYNLYGSTEVAWATIATPADLRAAPGTAGKPPLGTRVRVVDDHDRDCPPGVTGRIFVGNEFPFEGYTGGGTKPTLDGLMSVGDMGHFDEGGRLFIEGREDDMIVSGGENVYPSEVEDLLAVHPAVADCAVVGVPDEEFGQRLKAFVVLAKGASLTPEDVQAHVRSHLARYKVPRDVEFLDELPRNTTGKVLRTVLRAM